MDKARAAHYYKLAADQGDRAGQYNYARHLYEGGGVDEDKGQAARYFKLSAD
jgi:TPR repeat protein